MMEIIIENCNNILSGKLKIKSKMKTVILAKNGTGKSTITKAISKKINNEDLTDLTSYDQQIKEDPRVTITNPPKNVMIFDENYSNQFVFGEKKVFENNHTFELMQIDDGTKVEIIALNQLIAGFKQLLSDTVKELSKKLEEANKVRDKRNKNQFKVIARFQGLEKPNPLTSKKNLGDFYPILRAVESKMDWYQWREKYTLIKTSENTLCPYCSQNVDTQLEISIDKLIKGLDVSAFDSREKLNTIKDFLNEYTNIKLKVVEDVIDRGSTLQSKRVSSEFNSISGKIEKMVLALKSFEKINFDNFVFNEIDFSKFDIKALKYLKNFEIIESEYNEIVKVGRIINGKVKKVNQRLSNALEANLTILNNFCTNTGIPYEFMINEPKGRILCKYQGCSETVSSPRKKLSYGEKNAISALLFSMICKIQKSEMIILDDPFSSFDEHKKFYVFEQLFSKSGLLKNRTVVFLTHDVDSMINLIYLEKPTKFDYGFALSNVNGIISENRIGKADFEKYLIYLVNIIRNSDNEIIKLVNLRKIIEIFLLKELSRGNENYNFAYHFISSHIKGGSPRIKKSRNKFLDMTTEQITQAKEEIEGLIKKFNLGEITTQYNDKSFIDVLEYYPKLFDINSKLIFMRYLLKRHNISEKVEFQDVDVDIEHFLNLVNHYETDKLIMLSNDKYSSVPEYVMNISNQYHSALLDFYSSSHEIA